MKRFCKGLSLLLALVLLAGLLALPAAAEDGDEIPVTFQVYYRRNGDYSTLSHSVWSAVEVGGEARFLTDNLTMDSSFSPDLSGPYISSWELYSFNSSDYHTGKLIAATTGAFDLPLSEITAAMQGSYTNLFVYPICSDARLVEGTAPWPSQNAGNTVSYPGDGGAQQTLQPSYFNASGQLVPLESGNTSANPVWYTLPALSHTGGAWYLCGSEGEMLFLDLAPESLLGVAQAEIKTDSGTKTGYVLVVPLKDGDGNVLYDADGNIIPDTEYMNAVEIGNAALTLRESPHVYYYSNGTSGELRDDVVTFHYSEMQFEYMFDVNAWAYSVSSVKLYEVTGFDAEGKPIYDSTKPVRTLSQNDDCEYLILTGDVILIPENSGEEGEESDWGYWYALPDGLDPDSVSEYVYELKTGNYVFVSGVWTDETETAVSITLPSTPPEGIETPAGKVLAGWDIYGAEYTAGPQTGERPSEHDDSLVKGSRLKANAAPGSSYVIQGEYDVFLEPVWADDPDYDPGCSNLSGSVSGDDLGFSVTAQKAGEITLVAARYLDGRMDGIQFKTVTLKAGDNQFAAAFPGFAKTGAAYKLFAVKNQSFAPLCAAWSP